MKKGTLLKTAFEQYEVLEQVGQGGCGTVYKCKSEEKIFAVKLVNKNKGREKIKRFRNELNFCQKNNGKNVIFVCDYGYYSENSEEYLFYAMPFYSQNLRNLMKNSISSERIIKIFFDICAGLSAAHKVGCVHRDLKPENILINCNGEAVICDFGIAHFEDDSKATTIETSATSQLANFAYHAPEQLNDEKVTPATDVFALGLILNEMFTKNLPFGENYQKIGSVDKDYSFLDRIVSKMIMQDDSERYQTIGDLLLDYRAYATEEENKKKIVLLNEPLVNQEITDLLYLNPIKIEKLEVKYGNLLIYLNNSVNIEWKSFFVRSLNSHTISPYNYENCTFSGNVASYNINGLNENYIKALFSEFKNACDKTNIAYKQYIENEVARRKTEEIERKKQEIKRLEDENRINFALKNLI